MNVCLFSEERVKAGDIFVPRDNLPWNLALHLTRHASAIISKVQAQRVVQQESEEK